MKSEKPIKEHQHCEKYEKEQVICPVCFDLGEAKGREVLGKNVDELTSQEQGRIGMLLLPLDTKLNELEKLGKIGSLQWRTIRHVKYSIQHLTGQHLGKMDMEQPVNAMQEFVKATGEIDNRTKAILKNIENQIMIHQITKNNVKLLMFTVDFWKELRQNISKKYGEKK